MTDDRRDPFFRRFAEWKPRYSIGTPLEQLMFMARSPRLVMSQSTFSWWATFLGNSEQVVCPTPAFGVWSGAYEGLSLIEQDRFMCLPCVERYRPTRREAAYQWARVLRRRVVLKLNRTFNLSLTEPSP